MWTSVEVLSKYLFLEKNNNLSYCKQIWEKPNQYYLQISVLGNKFLGVSGHMKKFSFLFFIIRSFQAEFRGPKDSVAEIVSQEAQGLSASTLRLDIA